MKHLTGSRILAFVLTLCLLAALLPPYVAVEAEAASLDYLTCVDYVDDPDSQIYIDTMMRYYINTYSKLQTALNNGKSVVFMFEGGSDLYTQSGVKYIDASGYDRTQAVVLVVQSDSSGNAEVVFATHKCSSIPDDANWTGGGAHDGSTTALDGIYTMTTVNHNGNYAAYTTDASWGWYTPYDGSTGWGNYCSGINIHSRNTSYNGGAAVGWAQSAGCQVIGYGYGSGNPYNEFMKVTAGITWDAWASGGYWNTFSTTWVDKGYYVLDRQLGLVNPSGTEYGSGSLAELYTVTDLDNITEFSTEARANASWDYTSKCTPYPAHCEIEITNQTSVNSQPCSTSSDEGSEKIETGLVGNVYTATKLFKNTSGNLWYQVTSNTGDKAYVYAGDAKYLHDITDDIGLSDASAPSGHVAGNTFAVNGTIESKYNQIDVSSVYIYSGYGVSGSAVTGGKATVGGTSYTLENSSIDYATDFGALTEGQYTYAIETSYVNYYATNATTLGKNTGTVELMTEYFMVISASADQSSCSHSYTTTTVKAASCTEDGTQVKSCSKCGKTVTETIEGGHNYTSKTVATKCDQIGYTQYTCSKCGDVYTEYDESVLTGWSTTKPTGVADNLIVTKTQYRYANKEYKTSANASESGYTMESKGWDKGTAGTVNYVKSWPGGFSTSNSLYSKYNVSPKTAYENASEKLVVSSDSVGGYLYYHWCYSGSTYSVESSSGSYTTFHAYYDTTNPSSYTCDTSDMSYKTSSSNCSNSNWWFVTEVNTQNYTIHKPEYTHYKWGAWSEWSDKAVAASDSVKVETRTVYRWLDQTKANHSYTSKSVAATCKVPAHTVYTCSACGYAYKNFSSYTGWSTTKPTGVSDDMIQSKQQYRYADLQTKTSYNATESGYTQVGSAWDNGTAGSLQYVKSWPSGFSTSSSLYTQYNKTPVAAAQSDSQKVVINSNTQTGYLYYHWCGTSDVYSTESYEAAHPTFHAYYDTTNPSNYTHDSSDDSYKTSSSNCSNTNWWFVTEVNTQKYTTYKMQYTHTKWGDWSAWSDTVYTDSDTRKVETQTLYRVANGALGDHKYVNGVCSVCGDTNSTVVAKDYYLIGYINGADYGCESDYQNMGDYKFVDGKLVATFDQDSYVFLKTTDNADWYMTKSYETGTSATFYNTTDGASEKMLIPGGVEITFALVENTDGSLTLSYTKAEPAVKPSITLKGTTLSLEDEILYNLYFTTSDMDVAPENMGMLVFNSQPANVSVSNADQKIDGAIISSNMYMVSTEGISGKNLADTKYLVAYAKLDNGSYVYSSVLPYSAKSYCFDRLEKSTNANLKALCVAILNYGAAAQEYFAATSDYTYTTLMNADLTAAQKALVKAYSSDMVAARGTVTASKAGAFGTSANGFTGLGATMSADGIFSINYYFTTSTAVDNVTMYYWNAADFASASTLTTANATGKKAMTATGKTNQFWADIDGIAAKNLDDTIYVCGVYTVNGTTYTTGVIPYSLGYYCVSMAQSGSDVMKPMAAATAVYGYYAKTYFGV